MKNFKLLLAAGALLAGNGQLHADLAGTFGAVVGESFDGTDDLHVVNGKTGAKLFSEALGNVTVGNALEWTCSGRYLLVGGDIGLGKVQVFEFDRSSFTELTGAASPLSGTPVDVSWRRDGEFFATVNGTDVTLETFSFDPTGTGSTTPVETEIPSGLDELNSCDWHPDGLSIAVGGQDLMFGLDQVRVFAVDSSGSITSTPLDIKTYGARVNSVKWSPDGKFLAIGGDIVVPLGTGIRIYKWDGSTLELRDSQTLTTQSAVNSVDWTRTHLVVGASNGDIEVFSFNNATGTLTSEDTATFGANAASVAWYADGENILVGGDRAGGGRYSSFNFDGTSLSNNWSIDQSKEVDSVDMNPLFGTNFCDCTLDDCGVTSFMGNFAVNPCRKLLTNFIDPVKGVAGEFFEDRSPDAITCFSGNVGLSEDRTLLTNRLCPVQDTIPNCVLCDSLDRGCAIDEAGCLEICGKVIVPGTLLVNNLGSLCNASDPCDCTFDDCDVLAFRSNLGVDPCRKLLTNFINPVREDTDVLEADDGDFAVTCFSGNMGLNEGRSLLTNRICPVEDVALECETLCDTADRGSQENATGCLELCGSKVIIPGKLLVNDFGPFSCTTKDGGVEMQPIRFATNVQIDGEALVDGQSLADIVAEMQLEVARLKQQLKK